MFNIGQAYSKFNTNKNTIFHKNINIDIFFFICFCIIGWVSIFSIEYKPETPFLEKLLSRETNYSKQFIWICISFSIGIVIININSKIFATLSYIVYFIGIILMILTIFMGSNFRGSKSWLIIGSLKIQVAQLMFIFTSLALSKYIANNDLNKKKIKKIISILIILVPMILTIYQSETGLSLVFLSLFIVLYREGISILIIFLPLYLFLLLIASFAISPIWFWLLLGIIFLMIFWIFKKKFFKQKTFLLIVMLFFTLTGLLQSKIIPFTIQKVLAPYQIKRLENTFKQDKNKENQNNFKKKIDENYNVKQSIVAIGSGGFLGKGFLNNTQTRLDFVPEQATDFIICSYAESFGFLGILVLLVLYSIVLLRIISFAEKQRSVYSRSFFYSFVTIVFFHLIVNIGMTVGIVPVIGIPLPFISYGGGSFFTFSVMYFMVVRLDMDRQIVVK